MTGPGRFEAWRSRMHRDVEHFLAHVFATCPQTEAARVARYVALNGGRRWRALVALASGLIFDDAAEKVVMSGACGVEIAHAATLLLDDLPSMDNARTRRGRPCAHLVFPDWAVDMTAAFLVNMAYALIIDNPLAVAERRLEAAKEFGRTALSLNQGQEKDVTQPEDNSDWENVLNCYRLKTGSCYAAAAKIGGILAGTPPAEAATLYRYGMNIGLSVQCHDDVMDVIGMAEEIGKPAGQDAGKKTCVDFFGLEGAQRLRDGFIRAAISELEGFDSRADLLRALAVEITASGTSGQKANLSAAKLTGS